MTRLMKRVAAGIVTDGMEVFEDVVLDQVNAGKSIIGLYPATKEETKADFEAWRKKNGL